MPIPHLAVAVAVVALGLSPSLLPGPGDEGPSRTRPEPAVAVGVLAGTAAGMPFPEPAREVTGADLRSSVIAPAASWGWPLDPVPTVVRRFELPPEPWAAGHRGVDLLGIEGQPVLTAGDGVVSFSGVVAGRGVVSVRHPGGWRTTYEPVRSRVPRGTRVRRGEQIGVLGPRAGHCAPRVCLHWGALAGPRDYRDPLALLGLVLPVLLPWA